MVKSRLLAELSGAKTIRPDERLQCRYWIAAHPDLCFDIVDISGRNVGGRNPWVERAAKCAAEYDAGGMSVKAITPPYFLATKFYAHLHRGGDDPRASPDIEDATALILEVPDIFEQLVRAGIDSEVAALWQSIRHKHQMLDRDVLDLVRAGLDGCDQNDHEPRIVTTLARLSPGTPGT